MSETNRQIRLAARPQGECKPEDWEHADAPIEAPGDGQFAGRTLAISLDPAMRGWLDDRPSYLPPVGLGEIMRAGSVLEVTESKHPKYAPGDHVVGVFGAQTHAVSDGRGAMKVDLGVAPASTYLGALGMPGMTAYFGLLDVGALQEGETVVVSGAAGAVGTVAGQIAKVKGCRVIGIAGGPEKCAMLVDELGFDAAIDYRAENVKGPYASTRPTASTSTSTTSAETSSTPRWPTWRCTRAWSSAARSASTTTRPRCRGRRTTSRCWSAARAWRASSSSTTPPATARRPRRSAAGSRRDG